jgi:hypothetical protein
MTTIVNDGHYHRCRYRPPLQLMMVAITVVNNND